MLHGVTLRHRPGCANTILLLRAGRVHATMLELLCLYQCARCKPSITDACCGHLVHVAAAAAAAVCCYAGPLPLPPSPAGGVVLCPAASVPEMLQRAAAVRDLRNQRYQSACFSRLAAERLLSCTHSGVGKWAFCHGIPSYPWRAASAVRLFALLRA